jgi:hypothetical protein
LPLSFRRSRFGLAKTHLSALGAFVADQPAGGTNFGSEVDYAGFLLTAWMGWHGLPIWACDELKVLIK